VPKNSQGRRELVKRGGSSAVERPRGNPRRCRAGVFALISKRQFALLRSPNISIPLLAGIAERRWPGRRGEQIMLAAAICPMILIAAMVFGAPKEQVRRVYRDCASSFAVAVRDSHLACGEKGTPRRPQSAITNAEIERVLATTCTICFKETPLCQAIADFESVLIVRFPDISYVINGENADIIFFNGENLDWDSAETVHIGFDRRAMDECGISLDCPISLDVENVPARMALALILKQAGLTYAIEDGGIMITPVKLVTVTYSVADLVFGSPTTVYYGRAGSAQSKSCEDQLIRLITETIAPESWSEVGGKGTIQYFPLGMGLAICQTKEVHEAIAELLQALRRMQDPEIMIETRVVETSPAIVEKIGRLLQHDLDEMQTNDVPKDWLESFNPVNYFAPVDLYGASECVLMPAQVQDLMRLVQKEDDKAGAMQFPRMGLLNGQKGVADLTEAQPFTTSMQMCRGGWVMPQDEIVRTGVYCSVQPFAADCRSAVRMHLHFTDTRLEPNTRLYPVVFDIPESALDSNHNDRRFMAYLAQPVSRTLTFDRTFRIADGHSALFVAGRVRSANETKFTMVDTGGFPGVLQTTRTSHYDPDRVLLILVTPRVVAHTEEKLTYLEQLPPIPRIDCKQGETKTVESPEACATQPSPHWINGGPMQFIPQSPEFPVRGEMMMLYKATAASATVPILPQKDISTYVPCRMQVPGFPAKRTQVKFSSPSGMKIYWYHKSADGKAGYTKVPLEVPGRYNFLQAAIFRLKLTNIPGNPGLEVYPTLEVVPANAKTSEFLTHNAVPVSFTDDDFKQVQSGNFVVKVIYLANPQNQGELAPGTGEMSSTQLPPGQDPIQEAQKRGQILLVIRMGNINP
jgi:hypothetical protein